VTDEASAIEFVGLQPVMVEGHADNIKITVPQDLALAQLFLQQQRGER
jgi:2-C-methyl-D-erythritol 4-phosphate cytidylyltransferase